MNLTPLESRDVPALWTLQMLSPAAGDPGDTAAAHSGSLALTSTTVEAPTAKGAVESALSGNLHVEFGGFSHDYPFGGNAFQIAAVGDTVLVKLEDLAAAPSGSDWDFNDRSWVLSARESADPVTQSRPLPPASVTSSLASGPISLSSLGVSNSVGAGQSVETSYQRHSVLTTFTQGAVAYTLKVVAEGMYASVQPAENSTQFIIAGTERYEYTFFKTQDGAVVEAPPTIVVTNPINETRTVGSSPPGHPPPPGMTAPPTVPPPAVPPPVSPPYSPPGSPPAPPTVPPPTSVIAPSVIAPTPGANPFAVPDLNWSKVEADETHVLLANGRVNGSSLTFGYGRVNTSESYSTFSFAAWWKGLLWEIGQERVEPRRSRMNPRVVKQQVSNYGKNTRTTAANPADANPF